MKHRLKTLMALTFVSAVIAAATTELGLGHQELLIVIVVAVAGWAFTRIPICAVD